MALVPIGANHGQSEFAHIKDRYGHELTDQELLAQVDRDYLNLVDAHVPLVATDGAWTVQRHELNARGDEASILQRQKSIEQVGIIRDIRGGPWLVQDPDPRVHDRFLALHWATLIQGAERAFAADAGKTNRCVQTSVDQGLSRCKIYSRRMPSDVCRFLIDLGNAFNEAATNTTILEKWRCTALIEPQWSQKRKSMNWSTSSLPGKVLDEKKFTFVNSLHRDRWTCYRAYEVANTFFREAQKVTYMATALGSPTGEATTVFSAVECFIMNYADLPAMTAAIDEKVMVIANDALRVLKGSHPEWIVEVIGLFLPKLRTVRTV